MSVSKIAILIERYKKGASVDECKNFFHPAQRELNELIAAQQRVQRIAFGAFLAGGFVGGILMLIVLVGLYCGR